MPDPVLGPGEVELYPSCTPPWSAGTHHLDVSQTVTEGAQLLIAADHDNRFTIEVAGGDAPLGPTDVLAVYPAPGSRDASPLMLPHLALSRRTLPWELAVPEPGAPWLTLLLLREVEITEVVEPAPGGLATLRVATAVLRQVLPRKDELALGCHVRRVSRAERALGADDDGFVAIAIGNRLPREAGAWTAFAVGLHGAWAQPIWPGTSGGTTVDLPVLHAWSFEVGAGADFEQLCAGLRGAAGALGADHPDGVPLRHERRDGTAVIERFRSPLSGTPTVGTAPPDRRVADTFSGQAMFELGRLLAMSDGAALTALQALRDQAWEIVWFKTIYTQFLAADGLPFDRGFPGLTDELRTRLAGLIKDMQQAWLIRIGGGRGGPGGPGGLDDLLRDVPIGRGPGGMFPPIDDDLLDRIRELIGGGFTDPVPGGVGGPGGPGGLVDRPVAPVAPTAPVAPVAPVAPTAPAIDPRITSVLERLGTPTARPSILDRLRGAVRPRRGGGDA